jgi:hypothetical protein
VLPVAETEWHGIHYRFISFLAKQEQFIKIPISKRKEEEEENDIPFFSC